MDKINIVLSCSQQSWNKCLLCESEEYHTYEIALICAELLKDYNANVYIIPKTVSGTETETLNKVVDISNDFIINNGSKGFHLDIHTDAGYSGNGSSGFYISSKGKEFISIIHNEVSKITPSSDGKVSKRNLYVLRETIAISGLIELTFHDKVNQIKHLHDNMNLYAEAIVNGLIKACGLVKTNNNDDDKIVINNYNTDEQFKENLNWLASYNQISSPDYWFENAKAGEKCKGEYVRIILNKFAEYFKNSPV